VRKTEQSRKRNRKRKVVPANQRRREILEAAAKVFSQKGYHETKVSDIAAEARIGHGTVYRFFPSKRALAREVIGGLGATGFIESLKESQVEDIAPDEFLRIIGKKYFGNLRNRLPVIRFAISEGVRSKEFGRQYYESPLHRLFGHLADFVAEFQKRGVFRQADSFMLGHIFYSMLFGFLYSQELMWGKEKKPIDLDEMIDLVVDVYLNGVAVKSDKKQMA
jgi:AcrR family transcriptional regulator